MLHQCWHMRSSKPQGQGENSRQLRPSLRSNANSGVYKLFACIIHYHLIIYSKGKPNLYFCLKKYELRLFSKIIGSVQFKSPPPLELCILILRVGVARLYFFLSFSMPKFLIQTSVTFLLCFCEENNTQYIDFLIWNKLFLDLGTFY